MSIDSRTQRSLNEAAFASITPKQIAESTEQTETESVDQYLANIAETYITSIIGNQLNESNSEEERTEMIADLVEHTNLVCHAVNTYFNLYD